MKTMRIMNIAVGVGLVLGLAGSASSAEQTVVVTPRDVRIIYKAVGTVRPRAEASVMAQASGRLLTVGVNEGESVVAGAELAAVEDRELTFRLTQTQRGLDEAEARRMQAQHGRIGALALLTQAQAQFERVKKLVAQNAATTQEMEQVEATYKQARSSADAAEQGVKAADAGVLRAGAAVEEARVALGYTRVKAPFDGMIVKRLVEPGDLAWPGRPLFTLVTAAHMRLEAHVREGLVGKVIVGQVMGVEIDALGAEMTGTVDEVVPASDPESRTFVVKVALPTDERLVTGMFGRLLIPAGTRKSVFVPSEAVRIVGQLRTLQVRTDTGWRMQLVRLGERDGTDIEVLSGLDGGEVVRLESRVEVSDE